MGRQGGSALAVGLVLLLAVAAGLGLLSLSEEPVERAAAPTSSSTLPGYPADPASTRPVVPWAAAPGPAIRPPPGLVTPCQASQLRVLVVGAEGATGHASEYVEVSNRSAEPCSIEGRPMVELRDGRGRLVTRSGTTVPFICSGCGINNAPGPLLVPRLSSERSKADYGEGQERPDLPFFTLSQGPCPGGLFPEGGALFLAIGGRLVAIESEGRGLPVWDYRCDEPPENYPPPGRPELRVGYFVGIPVVDFVDNAKVTVEISAPPRVRAGAELHYRIRTRLSGNVLLGVLGCPAYTQRIEGLAEERHRLNCDGLYDSAPRRLLFDQWFDMVLRVPRDTKPGRRALTWKLDPPFGSARASREVEVTR
jgi:hypothetical protein